MKNMLLLLFMSFILIACGGGSKEKEKEEGSKKVSSWSSDDRAAYMDQCVNQGGVSPEVCECVRDGIEDEYPNLPNMKDEDITPEMMNGLMDFGVSLSLKCYEELGIPVPPTFQMD